eukprot:Selendium_serpulae@DN3653_c0_g1_i2.p1
MSRISLVIYSSYVCSADTPMNKDWMSIFKFTLGTNEKRQLLFIDHCRSVSKKERFFTIVHSYFTKVCREVTIKNMVQKTEAFVTSTAAHQSSQSVVALVYHRLDSSTASTVCPTDCLTDKNHCTSLSQQLYHPQLIHYHQHSLPSLSPSLTPSPPVLGPIN